MGTSVSAAEVFVKVTRRFDPDTSNETEADLEPLEPLNVIADAWAAVGIINIDIPNAATAALNEICLMKDLCLSNDKIVIRVT